MVIVILASSSCPIGILLFYIGGTAVIGLLVPYNSPGLNLGSHTAASSPFVIAITKSGIKTLPSVCRVSLIHVGCFLNLLFKIINACLLTSAWSAASSDLYTSSRALCNEITVKLSRFAHAFFSDGLATAGNAPRIFLKTTKNGLPWVAISFSAAFSLLAYMAVSSGAGKVFNWFANMTAIAGLITWFGICLTYIRFHAGMKAQGFDRTTLPFYSNLQPFAAWYALIATFIICLVSSFAPLAPSSIY